MQNKHLVIALCSENSAKIKSTKEVFSLAFRDFSLGCYAVSSGVSETPDSDEEALVGCHRRIENLQAGLGGEADFIVALEGLTETTSFGTFLYGWAVLKHVASGKIFYGCSGKIMLPDDVVSGLSRNVKLSDLVLEKFVSVSKEDLERLGTNGILTDGMYTRSDEFSTALRCALGSMIAEQNAMNL
ncbi:inosine/xanthosine triphosphatase [Salmonella enterica]|nr:inosine/xanthosine triphosphatase [Salmonella enterica]